MEMRKEKKNSSLRSLKSRGHKKNLTEKENKVLFIVNSYVKQAQIVYHLNFPAIK